MGLFDSMFGKKKDADVPVSLAMRETLFGDLPMENWGPPQEDTDPDSPWKPFQEARASLKKGDKEAAIASWRSVTERKNLEPRHHLQAWHFLRAQGVQPTAQRAKQVLGVVMEFSVPEGLDVLAAYADNTARYYHHSGKSVIWEHPDNSLNKVIGDLLTTGTRIVNQIGPTDAKRPGPPPLGQVRLSFLTPSGLHFGQGGFNTLSVDPKGAPVIALSLELIKALGEKVAKE